MKLAGYGARSRSLVGLDGEDRLVGAIAQPVLLPQPTQVVQQPLEQAEDLVLRSKRPEQIKTVLCLSVSSC